MDAKTFVTSTEAGSTIHVLALTYHRSAAIIIIIFSVFKYRMSIKSLYICYFANHKLSFGPDVKFSFKLFFFGFEVTVQSYFLVHSLLIVLCKNKEAKDVYILVN